MSNAISDIHIISSIACKTVFDINHKGLHKIEDENYLTIFSDLFRSVPLYVYEDHLGIWLFSDFENFYEHHHFDQEIDEVGFWETILYGTPLWSRTLYKKIKQLPSASKIVINKRSLKFDIERYWKFDIQEDTMIKSIGEAAEGLNSHLNRIFSAFDVGKTYFMGLSGGLDSRLSLAYLSSRLPKENLNLFTFGFDERILEYKYSRSVANALGYENVSFHRMLPCFYREALEYMPIKSCGQIAISHCHILSFLKNVKLEGGLHISNFYSDALLGYATKLPKSDPIEYDSAYYFKKLHSYRFLNSKVIDAISNDIYEITSGFNGSSNYSSIDEYIYITERNSKFHMNLAWLHSQFVETISPYADVELFKFMISVPLKYREQKIIIDEIFNLFFPKLKMENTGQISSRFALRFSTPLDWYKFRLINFINGILRKGTQGHLQLFNKFQTEEHERLLFTCFNKDLKSATKKFVDLNLMSSDSKKYFDRLPFRGVEADMRFSILSMNKLIILNRLGN